MGEDLQQGGLLIGRLSGSNSKLAQLQDATRGSVFVLHAAA